MIIIYILLPHYITGAIANSPLALLVAGEKIKAALASPAPAPTIVESANPGKGLFALIGLALTEVLDEIGLGEAITVLSIGIGM